MTPLPYRWLDTRYLFLLLLPLLVGCGASGPEPDRPVATATPSLADVVMLPSLTPTATQAPPTATTPPTLTPTATISPTPQPTPTFVRGVYHIQRGDTLHGIALSHGMTVEQLLEWNGLEPDDWLPIDAPLYVPNDISVSLPIAYFVNDAEVVNGAAYVGWNTRAFVEQHDGYLARYEEGGKSGAEIIDQVAEKYHVGPRVLLATMELLSGWVTGEPTSLHPFGIQDGGPPNLLWQATVAAKKLMEGYYGQLEGRRDWVILQNGVAARLYPGTTPGTAAVANLLASVTAPAAFPDLMQSGQFQQTYDRLFGGIGGGTEHADEIEQPYFELPFPRKQLWYFSGGPHGGYGDGYSGWAALDFAPPVASGCWQSPYAVHAVAPGLVVSSENGETWVDLDGDGDLRTGWALLYMHLGTTGRVEAGQWVETGDIMGYPSCEGGISTGAHLHLARKYNGQWMPAHGPVPFQLGEWVAEAVIGSSYDGYLRNTSNGAVLQACDCRSARKNRFPERIPRSGR